MNHLSRRIAAAALALLPALALAHVGPGAHAHTGFLAGFAHPFTGADHLAAMLAVGMWSAVAVRPAWAAPLAFVLLLAAGALAGAAGLAVPAVEPMIAVSLLAIGLLLATRARLPVLAAGLLAGGFAFFHGAAHGAELGASPAALAGMLLASALLHVCGMALGRHLLAPRRWLLGGAGGAVALLGAALLVRMA